MENAQLTRFSQDVRNGIQYITTWIRNQAEIQKIKIDNLEWRQYSDNDGHIVEVIITRNDTDADQMFTEDELIHCQLGDMRMYEAFFSVAVKVESLLMRIPK